MTLVVQDFPGGLELDGQREAVAGQASIEADCPDYLYLPLQAHIGQPARVRVSVGEAVQCGQLLAEASAYVSVPVHAPASGIVEAIRPHPVAGHGNVDCIIIRVHTADALPMPTASGPELNWRDPQAAGVMGLGGAGFPSHVKLRESLQQPLRMLVINAVECEPWLGADDCLLRERGEQVVQGIRRLAAMVGAARSILAVKSGMSCITGLRALSMDGIELVEVPARYPAGGERQLVRMLTGERLDSTRLPVDCGVLVHNVATVAAIEDAACGQPLIWRYVTVAGELPRSANLRVRLGTPVGALLRQMGLEGDIDLSRVRLGGPMMGQIPTSLATPVTATTQAVLYLPEARATEPRACIRCGDCVSVCPAELPVAGLYERLRLNDVDRLQETGLFDCIECACCDQVCPSELPLTLAFREAKRSINRLSEDQRRHQQARAEFERRQQRLATPASPRTRREAPPAEAAAPTQDSRQAAIQAAIERSKARRRKRRPSHGDGEAE